MVDENESRLCVTCGLCCDGTLFSFVPLRDADTRTTQGAQFELRERNDGKLSFKQPCPELSKQGCGIYERRPAACRKFSCRVLNAYRDGALQMDEAEEKVRQAKQLRRKLFDAMRDSGLPQSGEALPNLRKHWSRCAQGDEGRAFLREHGAAMLRMEALHWYLDQHFWPRHRKS